MNRSGDPGLSIAAVVVTYNPDLDRLSALLRAIIPQVSRVYVVDNGSAESIHAVVASVRNTSVLPLERNRGLALAQNAGATAAIESGAEFILLLDQDSIPANDMLVRLLAVHRKMSEQGLLVGAVGPSIVGRTGPSAFVRFDWFRYSMIWPKAEQEWVSCDLLIASGMLIPVKAWRHVGPMDESLFIDKVDTDWCLRASSLGYALGGAPLAVLDHRLGEQNLKVLSRKGWTFVPAHHPFRYYYMFRNAVLLLRRSYATWRWRTAEVRSSTQIMVLFVLFSPNRWQTLGMMIRGLVDGLGAKAGSIEARGPTGLCEESDSRRPH